MGFSFLGVHYLLLSDSTVYIHSTFLESLCSLASGSLFFPFANFFSTVYGTDSNSVRVFGIPTLLLCFVQFFISVLTLTSSICFSLSHMLHNFLHILFSV